MMMKTRFTLIELLVVIAIIAILAAMLFPSLGSARKSAQRIACLGNIRQFSMSMQTYFDENKGWMMRTDPAGTCGNASYNFQYLVMMINPKAPTQTVNVNKSGVDYPTPYLDKSKTKMHLSLQCTSRERPVVLNDKTYSNAYGWTFGYFMNLPTPQGGNVRWDQLKPISAIPSPSSKISLIDGPASIQGGNPSLGALTGFDGASRYFPGALSYRAGLDASSITGIASTVYNAPGALQDATSGRHNRALNATFFDGHAESRNVGYFANDYYNPKNASGGAAGGVPTHVDSNAANNMFSPYK